MPAKWAPIIPYSTWAPDLLPQDTKVSNNVLNVVPRADGYGPHPSLQTFTGALPGTCRGGFQARNADGSVTLFAATATDLFVMNNTTFQWQNADNGGTSYPALPGGDQWEFVQFNLLVIAVQANVPPQVFTLGSSTQFSNLGGSPPQAAHIAIINRFLVLTGLLSNFSRIQWSDLDGPTTWTAGVGLSDFQDLPDGGLIHRIEGGDIMGIIFQDTSLRWLIYSPGSAVIFDIVRISDSIGIYGQFSSVTAGDNIYFCTQQGFKQITTGGYPTPIGKESIDRTFAGLVDNANLQLFIAACDQTNTRVYWAFKSTAGQAGLFDTIFIYDYVLQKWSTLQVMGEYLTLFAKPGLTLEALDFIAPGIITISAAANNGSGAIRLTVSGLTAGTPPENTNLNIENTVEIYSVTGGVPAGNFRFTIIDSTHIDLIGTTFTATGTGSIGGAIDQLPFSLDSVTGVALPIMAAFDPTHKAGFFNGPNLQAILETPEQNAQGRRFFISSLRPKTDCPTVFGSVGWRNTGQQTVTYTSETQVNAIGECPTRIDARYLRYRTRYPAGAVWTAALGVEPMQIETGTTR